MIRANIEAEISSLECKIEQKRKEYVKLFKLIMTLSDRHEKLSEDINDMVYKLNELRDQLEMKMIKGLYFKLNMDNPTDEAIHKFFTQESEKRSVNKIDLLYAMMTVYKQLKYDENILNCMKALVNITEHECYTYGYDTEAEFAKRFIRSMGVKS